mgnify:CR=1 FL=1
MDSHQSRIVDKYVDEALGHSDSENLDSDDDIDKLLDDVDDQFLQSHRQQRLQQLKAQFSEINSAIGSGNVGVQTAIRELDVMSCVTCSETVVIHFFQENFEKCSVINKFMDQLSERHLTVKWVRINVLNAPFLVEKLKIKVLPCLVIYKNLNLFLKILGYEFNGNDLNATPTVQKLESYLYLHSVLPRKSAKLGSKPSKDVNHESDDDLDL